MICRRYFVRGRVQGVFFRASARNEALRLGLTGYAKNLADGRVEAVACGEAPALEEFQRWLQHGPPAARVDEVSSEDGPDRVFTGFATA